jgi:hypothetical protein
MKKFEVVLHIGMNANNKREAEIKLNNLFEELQKKDQEFKNINVSLVEEFCNRW